MALANNFLAIADSFNDKNFRRGSHEVKLTKKDSNLYQICGTDYYIQTKYCYEYASYHKAVLIVDSYSSKVIFLD